MTRKTPSYGPYESCPTEVPGIVFADRRDPNLEKKPPPSCDVALPARDRKDHAGETGRCSSMGLGSSSCSRARDDSRFGGWSW